MWQAFREEHHGSGFEIVTVGVDTAGAEACRAFIEAASPTHPSLIDTHHLVAQTFGTVNIPNGVWIDEAGMIVRPAEVAPAPPSLSPDRKRNLGGGGDVPERIVAIAQQASGIVADREDYETALRDWIANGAASRFALSPDEVVARSAERSGDTSTGDAHFELAAHLETAGDHAGAVAHFQEAHRLAPDNFAYKRQAWSLEPAPDGPLKRFWQGPVEGAEQAWPYAGDWLIDVQAMGAANYYPRFQP